MRDLKPCLVCGSDLVPTWTDHHGIAQCFRCGVPYRILHYENDKRVEKPPECLFSGEKLDYAKRCWQGTSRRLSAVCMHLSFPGGFDVATAEDAEVVSTWCKANPAPDEEGE